MRPATAVAMKEALRELSIARGGGEQSARIGIHCGPCLALVMNERQDYCDQTVNMASRLQGIASDRILATEAVMEDDDVRAYIDESGLVTEGCTEKLRGIEGQQPVFAIRALPGRRCVRSYRRFFNVPQRACGQKRA